MSSTTSGGVIGGAVQSAAPPGGMGPMMGPAVSQPNPRGLLRVVTPQEMATADRDAERAQEAMKLEQQKLNDQTVSDLAGYVMRQFEMMQRHRQSSSGWDDRLVAAMRMFKGEYEPDKLAQIREFNGSEVYARIVAVKCRGATALLRDIYLSAERPWTVNPTPNPSLPDDVSKSIDELLQSEVLTTILNGEVLSEDVIEARRYSLQKATEDAAKKRAEAEAKRASAKIDDLLVEGGFYTALASFLVDLPLFPFACLKGPVVRIAPRVKWVNRRAVVTNVPRMYWERVSPFDLWWTPGVSNIADADVCERQRLTRPDINALLGLPGYNDDAIRRVLEDYGQAGYVLPPSGIDTIRATAENREDPNFNESGTIDVLEFHGSIQGKMLKDWGVKNIKDELRDYNAVVWLVGRHVIKATLSPSPRKRNPYYITSFEKVPGTVAGNALPDILSDIQDVCNATLRSLVNNMAIASGPQVVVNEDRMAPGADGASLYPWKRWYTTDSIANQQGRAPVEFFSPNMHAQELLVIYEKFTQIADEISAIPRYVTGSERMGGAGRTASGLAMLMNNAAKILQTVAANIDTDVFEPLLESLYEILMLTETESSGALRGDETIEVRGVSVAMQKETERQRQIEFLNNTNNPTDIGIMGPEGRAAVLRSVANNLGLDGQIIVPTEEQLKSRMEAERMALMNQNMGGPPGVNPPGGAPGAPQGATPAEKPTSEAGAGPRTDVVRPQPPARAA